MSIQLADIPAAVADYLDTKVTTSVSAVAPVKNDDPLLTPGEDGVFLVTVTNASAPDGVRLTNVVYHISVTPDTVAQLVVTSNPIIETRAKLHDTQLLKAGTKVSAMFCTITTDTVLEVGDEDALALNVHCVAVGDATIDAHIHADVAEDDLFPTGENSTNGKSSFSVV
jgi:hypothetical protein